MVKTEIKTGFLGMERLTKKTVKNGPVLWTVSYIKDMTLQNSMIHSQEKFYDEL